MARFEETRVLVTGGAKGMGRLWTERFLADGAHVTMWGRDGEALEQAEKELNSRFPGRARSAVVDVSDMNAVFREKEKNHPDGVDILVNNAGVLTAGAFSELSPENHLNTVETNLCGTMWAIKAFLPAMMARKKGRIVITASAGGMLGTPFIAPYTASKWGLMGLAESLKLEMRELGYRDIKFTLVCTAYVDTPMVAGVKAPLFSPLLSPERAVSKAYAAFKKERFHSFEPFIVKTLPLMRGILPFSWYEWIMTFIGVSKSMSEWKGRERTGTGPNPGRSG